MSAVEETGQIIFHAFAKTRRIESQYFIFQAIPCPALTSSSRNMPEEIPGKLAEELQREAELEGSRPLP
jgi:hypothetical protein